MTQSFNTPPFGSSRSSGTFASCASPLSASELEGQPVFEIRGLDHQAFPAIAVSPHSGRFYPPSMTQRTSLDAKSLRKSEDALVDRLIEPLSWRGIPVLSANVARAFVDLNRESDELDPDLFEGLCHDTATWNSPRVAAQLGVVPGAVGLNLPIYSQKLPAGEAERRLARVYHPFHTALAELVRRTQARFGGCLVVDCHSMPRLRGMTHETHKDTPAKWGQPDTLTPGTTAGIKTTGELDVVLGTRFGRSCGHDIEHSFATSFSGYGLRVEHNRPFAGGAITQRFSKDSQAGLGTLGACDNIEALQIELARALYLNPEQQDDGLWTANDQFYLISKTLCDSTVQAVRLFADRLAHLSASSTWQPAQAAE